MGYKIKGHFGSVTHAQFSPDGKLVVSCGQDDTIRLWNLKSGNELMILKGHFNGLTSVQFSPEGTFIVSSSSDGIIRIWDVNSGILLKKLERHTNAILNVEFSPDGQYLVSSSADTTIGIWNIKIGEKVYTLKGHASTVKKASFSSDGKFIVSCSSDKTIRIWNAQTGLEIAKFETSDEIRGETNDVRFLSDSQTIVACGSNGIQFWDVKLKVVIQYIESYYYRSMLGMDISSDGNTVAISCAEVIQLFEKMVLYTKKYQKK
ncbi:WD repeat-containing protein [Reticulomyxa filosa]|uniref:WD repeat-containing protein n=1 Tax=Reticulomyxa filosa TaxID=46433 RepID=X6LBM0_RETFI|nr:WD repeat-containing protein [Reticulomyxa filosa]|eukprot:ETN98144.1 WD repeat-containing protein [Reticulomyxa filosa]